MNIDIKSIRRIELELRYPPTGDFVDKRGALLKRLKKYWDFRSFKHDRVECGNNDNSGTGIITWKQSYINVEGEPNYGKYSDAIHNTFSRKLWDEINVEEFTYIRFSIYFLQEESELSYEEMNEKYSSLLNINDSTFDFISMEHTDVGFLSNVFEDKNKKITLTFGPTDISQMKSRFFNYHEDLPENGHIQKLNIEYKIPRENRLMVILKEIKEFINKEFIPFINKVIEKIEV
ncbi:MAG: hypothetical protein AWL62_1705 [Halanaerobium sp. T82-1]|nr:MAG: hypothetical protein AWL62_1705 [Halanaerobium sp. T82-1]